MTMNSKSQTITASKVRAELFDIARELIEDGFTVYYLPEHGARLTRWVIIERNGNTGTVQLGEFGYGLDVSASIKPSREYGSSLAMWLADPHQNYQPYDTVLDACRAAAQPTVRNFLGVTLPNDGMRHFDWCRDRLVQLTGA